MQSVGQRGEATLFLAVAGGLFAEPDTNDFHRSVRGGYPDGTAGIAWDAGRHPGSQVVVLADIAGDGTAVLAAGYSRAADLLAFFGLGVVVGGGDVADVGQRQ